jgi:ABC-2 type transport system ATP-binding protein
MSDKNSVSASPVVAIKGLSKTYEPFPRWMRVLVRSQVRQPVVALDGVSFSIHAGTICGVIGPNGAGKSTLFRILTGLTIPSSGTATVFGLDVVDQRIEVQRRIGFMPADDRTLLLRQTCWQNLAFHGRLRGIAERALGPRIQDILELVGLAEASDRVGFALSSGMRARLQLARALLHEPQILILDEPTSSVDPVSSHHLLELIRRITVERNLVVLISSHRVEEIEALHDNVVLLDRGRLIHHGDLDALRDLWERPVIELDIANARGHDIGDRLRRIRGVHVFLSEQDRIELSTTLGTGALMSSLDGQLTHVLAIKERRAPLREILSAMARQAERGES